MKKHRWAVLDELDRQTGYLKKLHEPFERFQRQAELLQNVARAAAQMMNLSDHIRHITESTAWGALKELDNQRYYWQRIAESPAVKAAAELLQRQNEYFRPIITAHDEFQRRASYISSVVESPAFRTIFISAFDLYNKNKLAAAAPQMFAMQITSELEDSFNNFEKTNTDNLLNSIEKLFEQKCKSLKRSHISFEGMLQILLAIVLFIYSIYLSDKTEENLINTVLQTEQRILKNIESLKPDDNKNIYYVVERPVRLRLRPSTKSPVIIVLCPNQRVSLIKSKGEWIYVEYFDYIDGLPKTGWVYKKYLKRLER